nr:ABC transporter permease [Marinicella sp. W31]MDC2878387.1 ABC transporter permease [Marinicella sp. W31]
MRKWLGPALSAPVTIWLLIAFAAPLVAVIFLSLHEYSDPFGPLIQSPSLQQFIDIGTDSFYYRVVFETIWLSLAVTIVSALLGYPVAYWLARMPGKYRALAFAIVLIPLLTNVVVRSLGIILLLSPEGLINIVTGWFGIPPVKTMLFNHGAVIVALTQVYMPFMVLALYDNLQNTSPRVHEAAQSLGASPAIRFLTVDLPLSLPGLKTGTIVVFLLSSTSYVSATMLGGKKVWTTGMLVLQEAMHNLNTSLAAALALVMTATGLLFAVLATMALNRLMTWSHGGKSRPVSLPRFIEPVVNFAGPVVSRLFLPPRLSCCFCRSVSSSCRASTMSNWPQPQAFAASPCAGIARFSFRATTPIPSSSRSRWRLRPLPFR